MLRRGYVHAEMICHHSVFAKIKDSIMCNIYRYVRLGPITVPQ